MGKRRRRRNHLHGDVEYLIGILRTKHGLSRAKARRAIGAVRIGISEGLAAGQRVHIHRFGTFDTMDQPGCQFFCEPKDRLVTRPTRKLIRFRPSFGVLRKLPKSLRKRPRRNARKARGKPKVRYPWGTPWLPKVIDPVIWMWRGEEAMKDLRHRGKTLPAYYSEYR